MMSVVHNTLAELGRSPKIAILRGGGIGDFLSTTAALRALVDNVPHPRITLITTPNLAPFCHRYAAFERVVVSPIYKGVREGIEDANKIARFFARMQREQFDLALQWHGGGDYSNHFVRRLGAALTAGFRSANAPELDVWLPYDPHQHEVLRFLDLVSLLGGRIKRYETELPLLPEDFAALRHLAGEIDLAALAAGEYLGMHVSAGACSRRWPPERFARVADRLLSEFHFHGLLITAGEGQEADAAAVLERVKNCGQVTNLAGRTSIGALAAIISRLRLYVTNDSGPAHMAEALGTPSVVIFGSGNPQNWAPLIRAWQRPVAVMNTPCRWMPHDGCQDEPDVPCLLGVSVEDVLAEARHVLRQLDRVWPQRAPQLA